MLKKERKLDPRVIRTRQLLYSAFMSLIPELGYEAITVQDITDRATLNRATFYLHYTDKQDLLTQIIQQVLEDLSDTPPTPITSPPDPTVIRRVFVHLFDHVARNADFYRVMLREPSVAPYLYQLQDHLQAIGMRMLANAPIDPSEVVTPPDMFVAFIGWAYLGVINWWVANRMPLSSERMAVQFMRLVLSGVENEFRIKGLTSSLENELRMTDF